MIPHFRNRVFWSRAVCGFDALLTWFRTWKLQTASNVAESDPLLALRGSGKHLWADEHADEYVRRLRDS
ncbi:MAG: hypothetical protein WA738_12795 [Candidatus Angelobacter sp.]